MDLVGHNRLMARNNRWSNNRLRRAVLALQPGEFEADRTGFFPSIRATLNHILAIDRYYLDALVEGGLGAEAYDGFVAFDDPEALARAQTDQDMALIAFCDGLAEDDLERRVITDRRQSGRIPERIGDLLAHLVVHQIHHRGQVHAMLSGTSVAPPQLDEFILDYDLPFRRDEVEMLGLGEP
jgi:uncharacterized damage-inducible protein DinB